MGICQRTSEQQEKERKVEVMSTEKLIYASAARKAILKSDPKLAYCIDDIKGVDAVEVVHGRWRVSRESEISKTVWCTACGEEIYIHKNDTLKIDRMPYCPNCGAKMDGDGNG